MSDQFEKKIILGDVPYSLSIEATAYCNLRCTMCANRKLKRKKRVHGIRPIQKKL